VGKAFSEVVDGLFMVDLCHTDPKLLRRFMGRQGAESFREFHELMPCLLNGDVAFTPAVEPQPGIAA
jgi:hypothetical protein